MPIITYVLDTYIHSKNDRIVTILTNDSFSSRIEITQKNNIASLNFRAKNAY